MRLLSSVALALVLVGTGYAQDAVCNPECADQPAQCCAQVEADTFLAEQCTSATSGTIHFVLIDDHGVQFGLVDKGAPRNFTPATTGTTTLGNSGAFTFTLGSVDANARFQILDSLVPIHIAGQCAGTSGDKYSLPFPAFVVVQGRALLASGRNPIYCHIEGVEDLLCFQVKGQVRGPFVSDQLCEPDRVEYACGIVVD